MCLSIKVTITQTYAAIFVARQVRSFHGQRNCYAGSIPGDCFGKLPTIIGQVPSRIRRRKLQITDLRCLAGSEEMPGIV